MKLRYFLTSAMLVCMICNLSYSQEKDKVKEMFSKMDPQYEGTIDVRYLYDEEDSIPYKVSIFLPPAYGVKDKTYPLLVLTDDFYSFDLSVGIFTAMWIFNQVEEVIVVGIDYTKRNFVEAQRARITEMTPTFAKEIENSGQAKDFASFLDANLIPYMDRNYTIDADDKAFYGHSIGGLFGVYLAIEYPDLFEKLIIGSPSLFWDNKIIFESLKEEEKWKDSDLDIVTFVGASESENMIANWKEWKAIIENSSAENINIHSEIFEDRGHAGTTVDGLYEGIRYLYGVRKE
ncbi:alpha/beta hydrolase [Marivirga sp.]|uniref:alpha/beta hydrolase n=1 Tax=Marivirga sp. TaxID=2018662 RepID=UPI003DA78DF8